MGIRVWRIYGAAAVLALSGAIDASAQAGSPGVVESARRVSGFGVLPGDRIAVVVPREPELTDTVMVNERGEAAFAKLGVIRVMDMDIAQVQDTLRIAYSRFLRTPAISVSVLRRVSVTGHVHSPSVYLVDVTTSIRELIARAGGITQDGAKHKVEIVRDGQRVKVPNWEGDQTEAGDLRSGDQVVVGRKNWWVLNALPALSTGVLVVSFLYTVLQP